MEVDKPVPVVNIPTVSFIVGPSKQGITGNIQEALDQDRLVSVVIAVFVPLEEALADIGINSRRAVIHLECYCEEYWLKSLEESWQNQSVDQWVEWLTSPSLEDEIPNIDWLIALFTGNKKGLLEAIPQY